MKRGGRFSCLPFGVSVASTEVSIAMFWENWGKFCCLLCPRLGNGENGSGWGLHSRATILFSKWHLKEAARSSLSI